MSAYKHDEHKVDTGDHDPMDFYAHLSQASYDGDDAGAKDQYLEQHIGNGWKMDGELSGKDRSVFVKPKRRRL